MLNPLNPRATVVDSPAGIHRSFARSPQTTPSASTELPSPQQLARECSRPEALALLVRHRQRVGDVVAGRSRRLLVVVGPCSIDDPRAAIEYAEFLREMQARCEPLLLCMRTYFEKPRTTVGWKGLLSDPRLDGSHDMATGLRIARRLLEEVALMGLPTATELLDPLLFAYLEPGVAWAAVGARTTESQVHRQLVSSLDCSVGFKNGTDGNCQVAVDAMRAAASPHVFPALGAQGRVALRQSHGNVQTHLVLRGGSAGPNYDAASVRAARARLSAAGVAVPRVMIDCSHGNSSKDYRNQPRVAHDVARQVAEGDGILGVMIESYLRDGQQPLVAGRPRVYGQSVTDGCIGLRSTQEVLLRLAEAAAQRPG